MSNQTNLSHMRNMPDWRFPERLVQHGTRLLTQQCWYWGCDVRRSEGNLLLEYGFSRTRPPAHVQGSSRYFLQLDSQRCLVLWSFGIFYSDMHSQAIFMDRFRCEPKLPAHPQYPDVWRIDHLPPLRRAGCADRPLLTTLFDELIDWIITYERTILSRYGSAYRSECLATWSRRQRALAPEALPTAWRALQTQIRAECAEMRDVCTIG